MVLSADNCTGQLLVAKAPVNAYNAVEGSKLLTTFQSGATIGTIYSWAVDSSGSVWWDMYGETHYFVKHDETKMRLPILDIAKEQGVPINPLSSKGIDSQITSYNENKADNSHWYDGILKGFTNIGTTLEVAIIIFIIVFLIIQINKQYPLKNLLPKK